MRSRWVAGFSGTGTSRICVRSEISAVRCCTQSCETKLTNSTGTSAVQRVQQRTAEVHVDLVESVSQGRVQQRTAEVPVEFVSLVSQD